MKPGSGKGVTQQNTSMRRIKKGKIVKTVETYNLFGGKDFKDDFQNKFAEYVEKDKVFNGYNHNPVSSKKKKKKNSQKFFENRSNQDYCNIRISAQWTDNQTSLSSSGPTFTNRPRVIPLDVVGQEDEILEYYYKLKSETLKKNKKKRKRKNLKKNIKKYKEQCVEKKATGAQESGMQQKHPQNKMPNPSRKKSQRDYSSKTKGKNINFDGKDFEKDFQVAYVNITGDALTHEDIVFLRNFLFNMAVEAMAANSDRDLRYKTSAINMDSYFLVTCLTAEVLEWVSSLPVPSYNEREFKLIDETQLPGTVKIKIFMPQCDDSFEDIVKQIKLQNPKLRASNWQLLSDKKIGKNLERRTLIVMVDEAVIDELEELEWRPFFQWNRINVFLESQKTPEIFRAMENAKVEKIY